MEEIKSTVIILAGGFGSRFCSKMPKQFHTVNGKNLIEHTIEKYSFADQIIITYNNNFKSKYKNFDATLIEGGSTRKESLSNALASAKGQYIFIQESARYNVSSEIIEKHVTGIVDSCALNTVKPVVDTVYNSVDGFITKEVGKEGVVLGQGPQSYNIKKLGKKFILDYIDLKGDIDLCTHSINQGIKVGTVLGDNSANKVTNPGDL